MFSPWSFTVMAAALLVVACGPAPSAPPESSAPAEPKQGGTLRVRSTTDPSDWDLSYTGKNTPNGYAMLFAYNSLLGYKAGPDVPYNDGVLEPELAERWEVSPDAKTFTFFLRKGVTFAPSTGSGNMLGVNGRDLTSADVKWSYEYWSRTGEFKEKKLPVGQFEWMYEGLDRIDTPDPHTAVIRFGQPSIPFLRYTAADHNPVVPRELYDKEGNLKSTIAGSGPYQLDAVASQAGSRWVWKKNPSYWEPGRPYINEVQVLIIPEDGTAYSAFQTKQIDVLGAGGTNIRLAQSKDIERAAPAAVKYEYESAFPQDFFLRVDKPPLDDVRVRRAIALSVDREEFMRTFQEERGTLQVPGVYLGYFTPEETKRLQPHDPEAAKRLLAEAGYPNGLEFEFSYPGNLYGDDYLSQMQLLQAQLRKANIRLTFKNVDAQTYISNRREGNFHINLLSGGDAKYDVDFPLTKFHARARSNYYGVKDADLTRLIERQRAEVDPGKRRELIRQIGRMIIDRSYGVGMYSQVNYYFWHPHLKDYAPNWNISSWPIINSWLDK